MTLFTSLCADQWSEVKKYGRIQKLTNSLLTPYQKMLHIYIPNRVSLKTVKVDAFFLGTPDITLMRHRILFFI